jgi:hypothetical protein
VNSTDAVIGAVHLQIKTDRAYEIPGCEDPGFTPGHRLSAAHYLGEETVRLQCMLELGREPDAERYFPEYSCRGEQIGSYTIVPHYQSDRRLRMLHRKWPSPERHTVRAMRSKGSGTINCTISLVLTGRFTTIGLE